MPRSDDFDFEERVYGKTEQSNTHKFRRFMRYLRTRKMECWGFFIAGYIIASIF